MPSLVLLDVFLNVPNDHTVILFKANRRRLDHIGFWHFSGSIIWDWNDGTVGHSRMSQEMGFEFRGSDL